MKKTVVLIIAITTVTLVLLYRALGQSGAPQRIPTIAPTQFPSPPYQSTTTPLTITLVRPARAETNVTLSSPIVITFNRRPVLDEVAFTIAPTITYQTSIRDSTLIITPATPLSPGTLYTYSLGYGDPSKLPDVFTFTTGGPTPPFLPDTQPQGAKKQADKFLRENYPDIYLQSFIPYQTTSFSINSEYRLSPTGHYAFTVTTQSGDLEKTKRDVHSWMKSLGLTEEQIQALDITYQ